MKLILTSISQKDLESINIELKDKKISFDPRKHLQFNADFGQCNEFLAEHATLIALAKTAEADVRLAEAELAGVKARVDGNVRSGWDADRDGKMTEAGVAGRVRTDKNVMIAESHAQDSQTGAAILSGLLAASSVKYAQVVAYLYTSTKQP